ncbi:ArsR/SmtB family transcription factor [Tepidimonas charontis]|uniref:Arsenic resistance transcriptional regulator ArsR1 n=1 Tax=Tepidimonas charontis TaxID=2267262 RepID=A0A554X9W1_9BURK|nr:metalloregulator ArsR/SmtB family transcription factor [Tepidimonas charontis]TSE32598.1 Arsenic resistance transcriptional regulator ArsR1 [Tepidimonas charontis]
MNPGACPLSDEPPAAVFEAVARRFSVLGEPTRLRILHAVCQAERCVNDIMHVTGLEQANVSRHLARLYQAGLLMRRRVGNRVFYRASRSPDIDLCRLVVQQVMVGQAPALPGRVTPVSTAVFPVESKEETSV